LIIKYSAFRRSSNTFLFIFISYLTFISCTASANESIKDTHILNVTSNNILAGIDLKKGSHIGVEKVKYKTTSHGDLFLHIFKPDRLEESKNSSALVLFHGGGFKSGDPGQFYPQAKYLSQFGITVISAEYRIKNKHGTDRIHSILDGKSAVEWISENSKKLGIDKNKIAVGGGSAGGFMASVIPMPLRSIMKSSGSLMDIAQNEPIASLISPAAAILYNPGLDLELMTDKYFNKRGVDSTFSELKKGYPPTLILLGSDDWLTSKSKANRFCLQLHKYGVRCDIVIYQGQEHGFFNSKRNLFDTTLRVESFLSELKFLVKG
tara:strand:- start:1971 stop:2933 length:963 start_codon:yes stop_codon:yes gene_type:complete